MSKTVTKHRNRATFSAWATEWLELMKPTVKGNTFAASYKNPVENHLIPRFGKQRLDEIRQIDVQAYINQIADKFARDTVKKHKSCLYQLFETAVDNDLCAKNPARKLKIPDNKERTEKSGATIKTQIRTETSIPTEELIHEAEAELKKLKTTIESDLYQSDFQKLNDLYEEKNRIENRIDLLYDEWAQNGY